MTPPQTTRVLLETDALQVGEFKCVPAHPLWSEVNDNIGSRPHVVFPRATVYIERSGCNPVLATPNHVVFYGSHERYRRQLHDPRGARATFVAVEPGLWEELVGAQRPVSQAASDPDVYLVQHLIVRHLREEAQPDLLFVEEALHGMLGRAVQRAFEPAPRAARPGTKRAHEDLAEAAKNVVADRIGEALSLNDVAEAVYASPFHLARVFHACTGFTLHRYRLHLRLRASLARLSEPGTELTGLAFELGFSSLGHFSDSFRGAFGLRPSAARARGGELRKIVEARLTAAP
jgi:AraC family transcriptional regulator